MNGNFFLLGGWKAGETREVNGAKYTRLVNENEPVDELFVSDVGVGYLVSVVNGNEFFLSDAMLDKLVALKNSSERW